MTRKIVNLVLFEAAWLVCVLSGKAQRPLAALAAAGVVVGVSLWLESGNRLESVRLLALVVLIGFCVDTANLLLGVFALTGSPRFPYLCPLWLIALWAAFGTTLRGSLSWLAGRYWLSALLGAMAGAGSYLAGVELGAARMGPTRTLSLVVLGTTWAGLMPLLVWLAHRRPGAPQPKELS